MANTYMRNSPAQIINVMRKNNSKDTEELFAWRDYWLLQDLYKVSYHFDQAFWDAYAAQIRTQRSYLKIWVDRYKRLKTTELRRDIAVIKERQPYTLTTLDTCPASQSRWKEVMTQSDIRGIKERFRLSGFTDYDNRKMLMWSQIERWCQRYYVIRGWLNPYEESSFH